MKKLTGARVLIQKIRNRIKNSSILTPKTEVVLEKTYDNRMYGMLDILTAYSNIDSTSDYSVRIQHGLVDPNILVKDYGSKINNRLAQLVWDKPKTNFEIENVYSIGSPFLYLKNSMNTGSENKELVVVPHGGTYNNTGPSGFSVDERHSATLQYLNSQNSSSGVLLYWHDFVDPKIRSKYAETGLKVHCSGFPGLPTIRLSKNKLGGQTKFLENTKSILSEYSSIRIMEPTTTAVYGAFLGLSVKYDQANYLEQLDRETLVFKDTIGAAHKKNGLFQSEVMSRLTQRDSKEEAGKILGFHNKKSVDELASILNKFRSH